MAEIQGRAKAIKWRKMQGTWWCIIQKGLSFSHLSEQHNVLCVGIHVFQRNRTNTRKKVGVRADGIFFFSYCEINCIDCGIWKSCSMQLALLNRKPNVSPRVQRPENLALHLRAKQPYPCSRRKRICLLCLLFSADWPLPAMVKVDFNSVFLPKCS